MSTSREYRSGHGVKASYSIRMDAAVLQQARARAESAGRRGVTLAFAVSEMIYADIHTPFADHYRAIPRVLDADAARTTLYLPIEMFHNARGELPPDLRTVKARARRALEMTYAYGRGARLASSTSC